MNIEKIENKLLSLYKKGKKRTASNLAKKYIEEDKIIFTNKELLKKIIEPYGYTIAHKIALIGHSFEDKEILSLCGENRNKINVLLGHHGSSVAFILAKKGFTFDDIDIQKLGSERGKRTVAHEMAENGYTNFKKEILMLKDNTGISVAHVMAKKGFIFEDEEILNLENIVGFSVKNIQENRLSNN